MTVRTVLVGIIALGLLSALLVGVWDSIDESETTSVSPRADTTPRATTQVEPRLEFLDADLESGLEAICANDAQDSTDEAEIQAYEQAMQTASDRLAVSSLAEHLLAAALLEEDSASQLDLIKRAVLAGPTDSLVLWSAVRICSESQDSVDCPLREWEQQLIAVDSQNSESWMRIAINRYAAGEESAALEAMRFASTAAESRIYWIEIIESIERSLLAVGDFGFPERVVSAIGVAASTLPRYSGLTTMCGEQSPQSVEWADTCLRYGELVERQGKTLIGVSIAASVQRMALEATGESERAADVEQRIRARRQGQGQYGPAMQLAMTNPNLFFSYLAAIRSEGELAAQGRIAAEVERLVEQQPELACD